MTRSLINLSLPTENYLATSIPFCKHNHKISSLHKYLIPNISALILPVFFPSVYHPPSGVFLPFFFNLSRTYAIQWIILITLSPEFSTPPPSVFYHVCLSNLQFWTNITICLLNSFIGENWTIVSIGKLQIMAFSYTSCEAMGLALSPPLYTLLWAIQVSLAWSWDTENCIFSIL